MSATASPRRARQTRGAAAPPAAAPRGRASLVGSPAHDAAGDVLEAVPAIMDALREVMRRHVDVPLSVPQFRCLNYIAQQPASSIGDVAGFLGVTMPTASAMVDRLVRAGAVRPGVAEHDRRRSQLHLTSAGMAQLGQIRRGAKDELALALAALGGDDLDTLRRGLAVLQRALAPPRPASA